MLNQLSHPGALQLDFLIPLMVESVVRFLGLLFESGQELREGEGAEQLVRSPVTHWHWGKGDLWPGFPH